jgi:predicted transcriptional regulator
MDQPRRMTAEQLKEHRRKICKRMLDRGDKVPQIADALDMSEDAVRRFLFNNNIRIRAFKGRYT